MRFIAFLASTLLTSSLSSASLFGSSTEIAPFNETLKVPGENPLQHCQDPEDDILELDNVDIDPNPPKPGKTLTVTASGTLHQNVTKGAKLHLQVKYGLITIIKQTADLCDTAKQVNLTCPLEKGDLTLTKEVDLPKQIPPGKYSVVADVVTEDDDKVTCLTATVEFKRGGEAVWKQGL